MGALSAGKKYMGHSSGERFRRIIRAWRDEQNGSHDNASSQLEPSAVQRNLPVAKPVRSDQPSSSLSNVSHAPVTPAPVPKSVLPDVQWPSKAQGSSKAQGASKAQGSSKASHAPVSSDPIPEPVELLDFDLDLDLDLEPGPDLDTLKTPTEARQFLERLRAKTNKVVQDFAGGVINQRQFQAVYGHYQRQRREIEQALIQMPGSGAWRAVAVEGHTTFLREQHAAQVFSYAIYETISGMALAQVGDLCVDPELLVPMLSSFRSITQELFGAGMRRTEIDGGRWLCFVPGQYTTLLVIFSAEPAVLQLQMIEDLHRDFELVNQLTLSSGDVSRRALTFTHLWAFEGEPVGAS